VEARPELMLDGRPVLVEARPELMLDGGCRTGRRGREASAAVTIGPTGAPMNLSGNAETRTSATTSDGNRLACGTSADRSYGRGALARIKRT